MTDFPPDEPIDAPPDSKAAAIRGERASTYLDAASDDVADEIVAELERQLEDYRELVRHIPGKVVADV